MFGRAASARTMDGNAQSENSERMMLVWYGMLTPDFRIRGDCEFIVSRQESPNFPAWAEKQMPTWELTPRTDLERAFGKLYRLRRLFGR